MYRRIMVPVDLEHVDHMEKALHGAAELATSYSVPVCYVAVAGRAPNEVAATPEQFARALEQFARDQADAHGIETSSLTMSSVDVPAELDHKLLEAIRTTGSDLVVMASHSPGVSDRLHLIGSNAAWLVRHTDVSVFVVR
ncbi:MAG: universal stress protein [Pseudohongiellaceae bacterium]